MRIDNATLQLSMASSAAFNLYTYMTNYNYFELVVKSNNLLLLGDFLRQIQIARTSNIKYSRNTQNYLINKDNPQQVFFKNTVQRLNVFGRYTLLRYSLNPKS